MTPNPETLASPRLWLAFATMLLVSGIANTYLWVIAAALTGLGALVVFCLATRERAWSRKLGGGLRPPSESSPQESVAPAKPALEPGVSGLFSDRLLV